MPTTDPPPRARLLFDADDTLWRSNAIFEDVYNDFDSTLQDLGYIPADVLDVFRAVEAQRVGMHGTGHGVFLGTLKATCHELGGPSLATRLEQHTSRWLTVFEALGSHLYDDTEVSLRRLHDAAPLALVTRGTYTEQHSKITLSGLAHYFDRTFVVPEKDSETYRGVLAELGWEPEQTWMVGNSVRHDILPAIAAGLGAVHVDREPGWVLEHAERPPASERCLTVTTLTEVADLFGSPTPQVQ